MKKTSTGETSIFRPLLLQMLTTFCIFFLLLWPAPVSGADRDDDTPRTRRNFNDAFLELVEVTDEMNRTVIQLMEQYEIGLEGQPQWLDRYPRHFALILFTFFHERMVNAFGDRGNEQGEGLEGTNNPLLVLLQDLNLMPNPYKLRHAKNRPFSELKQDWAEYRRLYQPNLQFDTLGTILLPELQPLFADLQFDRQRNVIGFGQVKQLLLAFVDQYMLQVARRKRFADRMRNAFKRYPICEKRLVRINFAIYMILLNPFTQLIVDWLAIGVLQDRDNPAEPFPGFSFVTIGEELHFQPQVVPLEAAVEVPFAPARVADPVLDSDDSLSMDAEMMVNFQLPQIDPQEVERLLAEGGGGGGAQQQMHLPPHPAPPPTPPPEVAEPPRPQPFVLQRGPLFCDPVIPAELPERLFSDSEGSNSSMSDYE